MATQPELAAARSRLRRLREIEAALREVGVPPHPAIDLEIASLDATSMRIQVPCALCGRESEVDAYIDDPRGDLPETFICVSCGTSAMAQAS